MEIKRAAEPMIGPYKSEGESQKVISESKSTSSGIASARDSFDSGREHPDFQRPRWMDETDLKQQPEHNSASEFDGRAAANEIQNGTNNPILLPETPMKVYTRKESK
ncbi:MAG TPA: hypothetical protein VH815_16220 [Acidobacteriota bacterium]